MQNTDLDETDLRILGVLGNVECVLSIKAIHSRTNPRLEQKEIEDRLSILEDKTEFVEISLGKKEAELTALGRQYLREHGQPVRPGYWRSKKLNSSGCPKIFNFLQIATLSLPSHGGTLMPHCLRCDGIFGYCGLTSRTVTTAWPWPLLSFHQVPIK
ncbi:MAG: hypothetical protein ACYDHX_04925 [Methanothrix sp.]